MNKDLQAILSIIQQSEHLSNEEKNVLVKAAKAADKELELTAFKLERTEKVKRTTSILLEETIEELEQKRKAVEAQNRELEIESSLERVRTVAMGMRKPADLLDICEILFAELRALGFKELRNALISTYEDEDDYLTDYDYSDATGGNITKIPYQSHPALAKFQKQIRSARDAFAELIIGKDQLNDWKEYRRSNGEPDDPRLENIASLYYYFYSIGTGAIGISTFSSITEEQLIILKRFRNVFDFAYRRYMDVAQAEAQAREATIESALEKVRGRAMAMHKSDELLEAGELLYSELSKLGILSLTTGYVLMDEEEKIGWNYTASPADGKRVPLPVGIPHTETSVMKSIAASWKKQEPYYFIELDAQETIAHQTYIAEHSINFPYTAAELISFSPEKIVLHNFNFKQGYLLIVGSAKFTADQEEMMLRFTKVFEMTYRRFLDLQKAEAQARESQIELALERVRARTMAMQKSDELLETSMLLFKQLRELGETADQVSIVIVNEEEGIFEVSATVYGNQMLQTHKPRLDEPYALGKVYQAWKKKQKNIVIELAGEVFKNYNIYRNNMMDTKVFNEEIMPGDR